MKTSTFKGLLIGALIWALLPWLFWCVCQVHKPDHADPFWLPAMPIVLASFIPMLISHYEGPDWFPIGWVIASSVFNLVVGVLVSFVTRSISRARDENR